MYQDSKYNLFHIYDFFLHSHQLHFLPSNLHLHSHDICLDNVLNSFISIIMLKTLRFKSSALFGTHTLLDKSLRILPVPYI